MKVIREKWKIIIIIASIVLCIALFLIGVISNAKTKSKEVENASVVSNDKAISSNDVSSTDSQVDDVLSKVEKNLDSKSEEDDVIKPIDCNQDFWAVKCGIAECYDHIFKKGHMDGTVYYQGDCDKHDSVEINEIARKVKLYRDDNGTYTAILPEIEWSITLYDPKLYEIIDAQIQGSGEVYPFEEVTIVMYYSDNDNTLTIETVKE